MGYLFIHRAEPYTSLGQIVILLHMRVQLTNLPLFTKHKQVQMGRKITRVSIMRTAETVGKHGTALAMR